MLHDFIYFYLQMQGSLVMSRDYESINITNLFGPLIEAIILKLSISNHFLTL